MLATTLAASPALAGQVHSRKVQLSDDHSAATSVTYDVYFNAATTQAGTESVRFQFCSNSPLYNSSCTAPGGTFVEPSALTAQTDNGGALAHPFSYGNSGADILIANASGNTFTSGDTYHFTFTGATNPTVSSNTYQELYLRVITCTDTTCTVGGGSNVDNGGFGYDIVPQLSETANVQEELTFCVAQSIATPCSSISGSTVTLSPNPMSSGGNSNGTAQMAASTNASGGYVITYNASSFTDATSDTIASASSGGAATNGGGTEQFGFTLGAQTSGNLNGLGTANNGGSGSPSAPYNGVNSTIAYNTAGGTQVASTSGPSSMTTYTMLFAANVANTTKPGIYTSTQTYIATGTY